MLTQEFNLVIDAAHPSLPGHFPGHPIVPGVLLLDRVIALAEQWLQRPLHIRCLQQAKFIRPLLPDQQASVLLTHSAGELRFEIRTAEEKIAQGVFNIDAEMPR